MTTEDRPADKKTVLEILKTSGIMRMLTPVPNISAGADDVVWNIPGTRSYAVVNFYSHRASAARIFDPDNDAATKFAKAADGIPFTTANGMLYLKTGARQIDLLGPGLPE